MSTPASTARRIEDNMTSAIMSLAGLRILKRLRGSAQDVADLEALGPES